MDRNENRVPLWGCFHKKFREKQSLSETRFAADGLTKGPGKGRYSGEIHGFGLCPASPIDTLVGSQ